MVNGSPSGVKSPWIREYHSPDYGSQSGPQSVKDTAGNCPRCGKVLSDHVIQDDHNMQQHVRV